MTSGQEVLSRSKVLLNKLRVWQKENIFKALYFSTIVLGLGIEHCKAGVVFGTGLSRPLLPDSVD